ncbi:DUF4388 domain-containing protein [Oscillatoria laete-virens NRMC-F 0139]|nr:DUF4388 domain-containing protein [Oscillatoria laete-virens]MDL5053949.1 DUF4388 domain-containing protein [Oscillatoria laete-virens NRMC-F 0139]
MDNVKIQDLVYTRDYIHCDIPVKQAYEIFKNYEGSFMAVTSDETIVGLVGKERLLTKLGSQFGWALHADKTIKSLMDPEPLIVDGNSSVIDISRSVRKRGDEKFFDDLIVATEGEFSGLIAVKSLIIHQFKDLERKAKELDEQREILADTIEAHLIDKAGGAEAVKKKMGAIVDAAQQLEHNERKWEQQPQMPAEAKMQGRLEIFSAIDLMQILIQGNKTGRLSLRGQTRLGPQLFDVFLTHGNIVHAFGMQKKALDALYQALMLKSGEFEFRFGESAPENSISGNSMGFLLEACRMQDEVETGTTVAA